jgi:erythromycin esterase
MNDLAQLHDIVNKVSIVGLGENSHGSSTIYKIKLQIIKYLVENEGFSIFALESPVVEADRINDYVLDSDRTRQYIIDNLVYPSWQTQEMIDIIEWIRAYNKTAKQKVEFRGFDMQDEATALLAIKNFAIKNDSVLLSRFNKLMKVIESAKKDSQQWNQVFLKTEEIKKYLGSNQSHTFLTLNHYLDIVYQSLSLKHRKDKSKNRDEFMAQNITWLANNSKESRKVIVSADNTHIT